MARRAKSGLKASQILMGCILLIAAVGGGWLFLTKGSDPHATTPTLDVNEFRDRSSSLEGNTYKFNAIVQEQLARREGEGRLLHVSIKKEDGSNGDPVGIRIPAAIDTQNIQKGQEFEFVVEVGGRGMLIATDIRKI